MALNIADRLRHSANVAPLQRAVVFPDGHDHVGRVSWTHLTFSELDQEVDCLARGLMQLGVRPGHRLVLMVRPSLEFIALTFAIFRTGATCVLIDPGMGKRSVLKCLDETTPDGFVAIAPVHFIRRLMPWRYRSARFNVIVGRHFLRFGCVSYEDLLRQGQRSTDALPETQGTDPAAIIFTSGSTGPPKGVLYEHAMFDAQVDLIRDRFGIQSGETDLPGFPLFALFNLAMQVTTIVPDMDPTRPAQVNPLRILHAMSTQAVTQAYGSPAMWNRIGRHCEQTGTRLPNLRRVLSAGAPVPLHVIRRMLAALPESADVFTPYGATECLPIASIGGREILMSTSSKTAQGAGTCVGRVFPGIEVRILRVTDDPIDSMRQDLMLPNGLIGEIVVRGPVATREYFRRPDATTRAKIRDGNTFWHRMGDVGYLDEQGLLWFCGRKAHIVHSSPGPMYSVCCEAVFNEHPRIYRSALVGVGHRPDQRPVLVAEPEADQFPQSDDERKQLVAELLMLGRENPLTVTIETILFHRSLPVDTRHNVKINREALAVWAERQLADSTGVAPSISKN